MNLKFSMTGLIYTTGALDCLAENKLIEPNLNSHYKLDHSHLKININLSSAPSTVLYL